MHQIPIRGRATWGFVVAVFWNPGIWCLGLLPAHQIPSLGPRDLGFYEAASPKTWNLVSLPFAQVPKDAIPSAESGKSPGREKCGASIGTESVWKVPALHTSCG